MAEEQNFRVLPHNIEAEQSLLGSLLIDPNAFIKIADAITAQDFYRAAHGLIFEAMVELYRKNEPIDFLTLTNLLSERGQLEKIGGRSYLVQLSQIVPTSTHVANYAKILHQKALRRRLFEAANDIAELSLDEKEEHVEKLLDRAERKLFDVAKDKLKNIFVPIKNILSEAFDRIDELHQGGAKLRGVPTGFKDLDNILAGLQKSDLIIIAARPSVGKTSLALDIAKNIATKAKIPVGLFSLEMSKEQLVDRLLCSEANVDLWKMRTGRLSDKEEDSDFPRIGQAMGILAESPIFIDDSAAINVMEIKTKARRLKAEHGLGLIVIDYLQLMESSGYSENRVQEVAEITRALKQIARELDIPVLALSQLSRAVEMNKPAIPKLAHLRESGSIEQDADIVIFIYRKSADRNYRQEDLTPEDRHMAEIHIAKHRNGPTGIVKLFFDEPKASFKNLEKQYRE
ncbi:replicative DNA helicase [Candidatus Falkowbacteria bacterium]|nr:replicative DNA helicase [Candidatus Falkowbacteria bacterium]